MNTCPGGYTKIRSLAACQRAADWLDVERATWNGGQTSDFNEPGGCLKNKRGLAYFNVVPGAANADSAPMCQAALADDGDAFADASFALMEKKKKMTVDKAPYVLGNLKMNICPGGYTKIRSLAACQRAADWLDVERATWNGGQTSDFNEPGGCMKNKRGLAYFNVVPGAA